MGKDTRSAKLTNYHNNDNAFFKVEPVSKSITDAVAYATFKNEAEGIIKKMQTAINNSDNSTLKKILDDVTQDPPQIQQAILHAIRCYDSFGYNTDPILTAIGTYKSGYRSELLKTILESEWLREGLKNHTYLNCVTALHIACLYQNEDAIKQLNEAGFDAQAADKEGRIPKDYGSTQTGFYPELGFRKGSLIDNKIVAVTSNHKICVIS